ncbi:hypothetical protein M8C21_020135 [Ambrosia artemisiifolia]|uniref:Uncharacterized protein n=1 Tax=Ambrosia artemisiifolia TaxID=4212 RepID=A0AAD5D4Q3_AMBAR|nr:hypothetical protein M8C21_020135 [Ambrosia artemisiifolia]
MGKHAALFFTIFILVAFIHNHFTTAPTKIPNQLVEEEEEEKFQEQGMGLSMNSIFRYFGSGRIDFKTLEIGPVSVTLSIEFEERCQQQEEGTEELCTIGFPTIRFRLSINSIPRLFG